MTAKKKTTSEKLLERLIREFPHLNIKPDMRLIPVKGIRDGYTFRWMIAELVGVDCVHSYENMSDCLKAKHLMCIQELNYQSTHGWYIEIQHNNDGDGQTNSSVFRNDSNRY